VKQQLRHPVAAFAAAVLVVIGIGVGVTAATSTSKLYGPSWGQFTVAFPGRVCGLPYPIRATGLYFETSSDLNDKCAIHWTGYAPLALPTELDSVEVYGRVVTASAMRSYVRSNDSLLFGDTATENHESANGFVITTLGPQCARGTCRAVEYVAKGRVLWTLTAIAKGSVSVVEGFLSSFQPIG
jgi:hypothetical protein